jgi:PPE-repeat protein
VFDFGALPPEINSARMYAGPGPSPLLASASAWDGLAAQLDTFGARYSSEISALHGATWSGGAASAMSDAAAPYLAWITATATQAEEAASQVRAAVAAYEAAFSATVPPAAVAANRAVLASLVVTNFLGQNTPAIAATEAEYAAMWAQDAAAMYGYAASASAATRLTSFGQPPQTTNPATQSGQAAATHAAAISAGHSQSTLSQLMSAVPQRLQALASGRFTDTPAAEGSATQNANTTASSSLITAITDFDELDGSTISAFIVPKTVFQGGSFAVALNQSSGQASALQPLHVPVPRPPAAAAQTSAPTRRWLPGVGRTAPIGKLSVPPNWTAATAAAHTGTDSAAEREPAIRALPPWANGTTTQPGMPTFGRSTSDTARRANNSVFRMRDRGYRMPRPVSGG